MQRTHVLQAMPPMAALLVCFVAATLLGVVGLHRPRGDRPPRTG
jgi:hypothetical protein